MTAQCVGRFFLTDGKYLSRAYKEHLSGFNDWEQKPHAEEWVLLEQNMGERLSIDETMLHHDLFTFLSNKDGHCRKGTLVAAVKGTTVDDVTKHLDKIPGESRMKVREVTMDFSDSMMGIVKKEFPQAEIVIDLFHIMQLYGKKGLDAMRMKLKRANTTEVKKQEREFKKRQEQNARNRKRYKEIRCSLQAFFVTLTLGEVTFARKCKEKQAFPLHFARLFVTLPSKDGELTPSRQKKE